MFWAFAASILILVLTITISNRGPVRAIGAVLLAGLLAVGLYQRLGNRGSPTPDGPRGKPSSPAAVISAASLDSINVTELKLVGGGAPFGLRGSIQNSSADTRLRSITLRITRRDCYEGAVDPSGCIVIWEDQHWMPLDIPAGSDLKFDTSFYAHTNVPRARGTIKDDFKLIAATGQPEPR